MEAFLILIKYHSLFFFFLKGGGAYQAKYCPLLSRNRPRGSSKHRTYLEDNILGRRGQTMRHLEDTLKFKSRLERPFREHVVPGLRSRSPAAVWEEKGRYDP